MSGREGEREHGTWIWGGGRQRGASERWMGIVGGRETEIDTQRETERQRDGETEK